MAKKKFNWKTELKTWTKPTRGIQFTALAYLLRKKKGPRWGAGALAGRKLMSKGKWLF